MFRFPLSLVPIAFIGSAASLPAQEGRRADLSLAGSWWVVSDGYLAEKVEREQVGTVVAFWQGNLYMVDADAADAYEVRLYKGDAGTRFEFLTDGKLEGKGLAVKDGDDMLRMFVNCERRGGKIVDPAPDKEKCDLFFVCLAFRPETGKARLVKHGIDSG